MANQPAAEPQPPMCICIGWQDDRGLFSHGHYLDMHPSDTTKILNRKREKELTARSTYVTIAYTVEPCNLQDPKHNIDRIKERA